MCRLITSKRNSKIESASDHHSINDQRFTGLPGPQGNSSAEHEDLRDILAWEPRAETISERELPEKDSPEHETSERDNFGTGEIEMAALGRLS